MRLVTVAEIFRRAKKRADQTNSNFFTEQDMFDLLNSSVTSLYDTIVQSFSNYYADEYFFSIVPGTVAYDLPADFYKLIVVERVLSPNRYSTIFPINELEKNSISGTDASALPAADLRLRYVPAPPVYTLTTETVDGISGWDDMIVLDMVCAMLEAEESDSSAVQARLARVTQRVQSASQNRDIVNPGTVTDTTAYDSGFLQNTLQYRFYGNQLEFYNVTYLGI
jgi:hypothetical protein